MARHIGFLLIGGGLTSATAAETLRAEGVDGAITILCMEVAASLRKQGIHVTLIAKENVLFDKLDSSQLSAFFLQHYKKALSTDLMEVMIRRDEIVYSERIRRDRNTAATVKDFRKLVEEVLGFLEPATQSKLRQGPRYIQLMGDVSPMQITRIIREGAEDEASSKDYDFSHASLEKHKQAGYEMARKVLEKK